MAFASFVGLSDSARIASPDPTTLGIPPTAVVTTGTPAAGTVPPATSADATSEVDARLDLDAALARIPPAFRAAVVLRDVCDLGYDEIAEVLGIPPGTVRSRIARGRAALVPLLAAGGATAARNQGRRAARPRPEEPEQADE